MSDWPKYESHKIVQATPITFVNGTHAGAGMKLKIRQVFDAIQVLDAVIRERRPMPQLGKYRLARMHRKLLPDFQVANAQREELITKYGVPRAEDGVLQVPNERMPDFNAEWDPIADHEVELDIEPVRLADMALGKPDDPANGALEASELLVLGDLVTE